VEGSEYNPGSLRQLPIFLPGREPEIPARNPDKPAIRQVKGGKDQNNGIRH